MKNVINLKRHFLEKQAQNLFERYIKPDVLSNKVIQMILPYTVKIIEATDNTEEDTTDFYVVSPEYVTEVTANHFHKIKYLARGIVRVTIFSCWYFDFYTLLSDNTYEEVVHPCAVIERQMNEGIIEKSLLDAGEMNQQMKEIEDQLNEEGDDL